MTSIVAVSSDFYNPEYFNILEQYEYDCLFLEYTAVAMEAYDPTFEALNGDVDYNKRSKWQRFKDRVSKLRSKTSDKTTKGEAFGDKVKAWFKYVGERLKFIIQKFVDKVDELFKLNKKFIDEQGHNVVGVDDEFWEDVKITVYPYDRNRITKTIYENFDIPKIDSKGDKIRKMFSYNTVDEMVQEQFKEILKYKGPKDSFTTAIKKYYRNVKGVDGDLVQLENKAAKGHAIEAYNYVKTYKDYTARNIRDSITELKGAMERIDRDFQNNKLADYIGANESYSPIFEADEPQNGTVQSASDTANGSTMVDKKDAGHVGTRAFARIKQYSDILMKLLTAKMTIAEEYYFSSLHLLKALFSKAQRENYIDKDLANTKLKDKNDQVEASNKTIKGYKPGKTEQEEVSKRGSA